MRRWKKKFKSFFVNSSSSDDKFMLMIKITQTKHTLDGFPFQTIRN